jgi:hypothetical protein
VKRLVPAGVAGHRRHETRVANPKVLRGVVYLFIGRLPGLWRGFRDLDESFKFNTGRSHPGRMTGHSQRIIGADRPGLGIVEVGHPR